MTTTLHLLLIYQKLYNPYPSIPDRNKHYPSIPDRNKHYPSIPDTN